ncbi:MAG: ABC transporter substrate-binding protein [Desulfobacterales bacterium]|nr:ABC transporter substrate-binding protein [Desulfobacterales bacterium]
MNKTLHILIIAASFIFTAASPGAETGQMALLGKDRIRDCAGREITVEKPFSRIISLYGAHTENLFSLDADDKIIGVGRHPDWPPAARKKPRFSPHDGPEKFLAARPDLILVRPMIDNGYQALIRRLESFGITVISLQPGNVDEMKTYWKILGRLTGRQNAAASMIETFERGVLKARMLAEQIEEKKKVYFEAIHDKFKTFSPGSMPFFALKCAGGINVAQEVRPVRGTNIAEFGKEQVMEKGLGIDVYLAQKGPMNSVDVADIENEPGFGVIKAVREGEIYIVDEKIVSRPTLRLLEGIFEIGEILYPAKFPELEKTP